MKNKMTPILGIDVGNTHTVIALWEQSDQPLFSWRIQTDKKATSHELHGILLGLFQTAGLSFQDNLLLTLSSVVPTLSENYESLCQTRGWEFHLVTHHSPLSFEIDLPEKSGIGADRLVNAEAAIDLFGSPLIIVDGGTATTFCAISSDKKYLGGSIVPGFVIAAEALVKKASKLAAVEWKVPPNPIGKNTTEALQSGTTFAWAALIDGMVEQIKKNPGFEKATCISTGGALSPFIHLCKNVQSYEPDLTLHGLLKISKALTKQPSKTKKWDHSNENTTQH